MIFLSVQRSLVRLSTFRGRRGPCRPEIVQGSKPIGLAGELAMMGHNAGRRYGDGTSECEGDFARVLSTLQVCRKSRIMHQEAGGSTRGASKWTLPGSRTSSLPPTISSRTGDCFSNAQLVFWFLAGS